MPGWGGCDQTGKEYAPHLWIGDHFIGSTEQVLKIGKRWYRAGRGDHSVIVCERWEGDRFPLEGQGTKEVVPVAQIPKKILQAMELVSAVKK